MTFDERITKLNEMIAGARHIVFFTGAGISTGSGIPDFRSADGLYNTIGGVKTASPECGRRQCWRHYLYRFRINNNPFDFKGVF